MSGKHSITPAEVNSYMIHLVKPNQISVLKHSDHLAAKDQLSVELSSPRSIAHHAFIYVMLALFVGVNSVCVNGSFTTLFSTLDVDDRIGVDH